MALASNCCGVTDVFDNGHARRDLDAYRRRGPSASTAQLLAAVHAAGHPPDTLLDVGGGLGVIAHELLQRGVGRATLVDSSPSYLAVAREESDRRATSERLELHVGDLVELARDLLPADVVTLDKVVCCYPDMDSLLTLSAARARRLYGIVYPRDSWWLRLAVAAQNRLWQLRGIVFRNFVHANSAIDTTLRRAGFSLRFENRGAWWVVALYERSLSATTPVDAE
jgi:magnesium-protoporphyrin O-methyltransferase